MPIMSYTRDLTGETVNYFCSVLKGAEKAMYLLTQTGVASVPGEAFFHGMDGETLVRFCFAKTDAELEEACQRLERLA